MQIAGLWRYPVKSLRGVPATSLDIEPWGAAADRRWAVVDPAGHKVSARTEPGLLAIRTDLQGDGSIAIETTDGRACVVREPRDGRRVPVDFSRLSEAIDGGDEAAALLTAALGRPLRLVWQPDPRLRSVNPNNGGLPGEVLSLADAGPLLLTAEASLRQLQAWVGDTPQLSMTRFRPNVVVDGDEPFAEDRWSEVELGGVPFRVQEICDRCVMTTIDPVTLEQGPEPLEALDRHHGWDRRQFFGVRLVPRTTGTIRVGDPVRPSG